MATQIDIMTICDGPALLIVVQNDNNNDARRYGYLVMPRRYVINEDLQRHFSLILSKPLMTPPLARQAKNSIKIIYPFFIGSNFWNIQTNATVTFY